MSTSHENLFRALIARIEVRLDWLVMRDVDSKTTDSIAHDLLSIMRHLDTIDSKIDGKYPLPVPPPYTQPF